MAVSRLAARHATVVGAMDLYVVRHAIAEERREGLPDADRALTQKGVRRFRAHVEALSRLEVRFDEVLTSPWRRATETAELLAPLCDAAPTAMDALAAPPGQALLDAIARAGRAVAVVGHEPWLGELIAWLVLGQRELGRRFVLKKGSVARLGGLPRPGEMRLEGLYAPKLLRLAGR